MKELIGKLSRGKIEYLSKKLIISVSEINIDMYEKEVYKGSFDIDSADESTIKGIVYSFNSNFKIINNQFVGRYNKINYEINSKYLEAPDTLKGNISIVSNAGEVTIPYEIHIKSAKVNNSVDGIFSFVELAKNDRDEARKVFLSSDFEDLILKDDIRSHLVYKGLIMGADVNRDMEEFLVSVNKKKPVHLHIEEETKEYGVLEEPYSDSVKLTLDNHGFAEVKISTDADFIASFKERLTDEDFAGNVYEFDYLIDSDRLHAGNNYGKITFKTIYETLELKIVVKNTKDKVIKSNKHEVKAALVELNRLYMQFRLHKISIDRWSEEALEIIEKARAYDDKSIFLKLLQAQIYIIKKRGDEAKYLIDSVADEVVENKDKDIRLYCYYLYVKTLHKRELEQTLHATKQIKKYYENGYDKWELLWILLYIDTSYENNKSLKLARIKEQFNLGCRSTLIYYEALYVLNKQPVLLRVINDFELLVLNFGSKYDAIEYRLAIQFSEIAMLEKKFRPLVFNILVKLYEKYKDKQILTAIISVLIRGNMTDEKYFGYYSLAVDEDISVTRLFEYYVLSMPKDFDGTIKNTVLMYYVYNGNLLYDREGFFYSKIIDNKDKYPNVYKNYKKSMESYALLALREGKNDEYTSKVYKDVLVPAMIRDENVNQLIDILSSYKIIVKNKEISNVYVLYKEISEKFTFPVRNETAYITMYTDDANILFMDINGNVYQESVDYEICKLYDDKDIKEYAFESQSSSLFVLISEISDVLKEEKIRTRKDAAMVKNLISYDEIRKEYKKKLVNYLIDYYHENPEDEEMEEFLDTIKISGLTREKINKLAEIYIAIGRYDRVTDIIEKYGYRGIDTRKLFKYCIRMIRKDDFDLEDDLLVECAAYVFDDKKYNEVILEYLCKYYNGTTSKMLEIWRISKEFDFESRDLEERLIAQILFTGNKLGSISTIYDSYYKKGGIEMIRYAYMYYLSYEYFVRENEVDPLFFKHLTDEIINDFKIMDLCKVAFLKYFSEKDELSENAVYLAKVCIDYLAKKKLIFDFYKKYAKYFNIPSEVADKVTIIYRTEPKDKVIINYYIETENSNTDEDDILSESEYISDEMKRCFNGLYAKSFTLFYGEKIIYYISNVKDDKMTFSDRLEYVMDKNNVIRNNSRYGIINEMAMLADKKEKDEIVKSANRYFVEKNLIDKLFD